MTSPARMMARLAMVVGAALLTFGYSSCTFISNTGGTGGSSGSGFGDGFSTTLVLRDSSGTVHHQFRDGRAHPLRPRDAEPQPSQSTTLQFPDSQIYDFYVLDAAGSAGPLAMVRRAWPSPRSRPS